jgi:hypothetical protein
MKNNETTGGIREGRVERESLSLSSRKSEFDISKSTHTLHSLSLFQRQKPSLARAETNYPDKKSTLKRGDSIWFFAVEGAMQRPV